MKFPTLTLFEAALAQFEDGVVPRSQLERAFFACQWFIKNVTPEDLDRQAIRARIHEIIKTKPVVHVVHYYDEVGNQVHEVCASLSSALAWGKANVDDRYWWTSDYEVHQ